MDSCFKPTEGATPCRRLTPTSPPRSSPIAGRLPPRPARRAGRGSSPPRPPTSASSSAAPRRRTSCRSLVSPASTARRDRAARCWWPRSTASILAAVPVGGGRAIADPFAATADLVDLLQARVELISPQRARVRRPRAPLPARAGRVAGAGARPRRAPGGYSGCGDTDDEQPADRARGGAGRARGRAARRRRRPPVARVRGGRVGRREVAPGRRAGGPRRDARVAIGECVELGEEELPYAPIVSVLRTLARDDDPVLGELPDSVRAELATLLPELGGEARNGGGGTHGQPQLFEALLTLLDQLGREQPFALVLEDIHWADRSTRAFLVFLARSLWTERVLVIATYRSDELHRRHPLRPLLAELERDTRSRRIELARLSRDELGDLLADILGGAADAELLERLYARSEGNPLFTEELLAARLDGRGGLPSTLRDALMVRIERLSQPAQEVLRVLSAGRVLAHAVLAEASGLDAAEVARRAARGGGVERDRRRPARPLPVPPRAAARGRPRRPAPRRALGAAPRAGARARAPGRGDRRGRADHRRHRAPLPAGRRAARGARGLRPRRRRRRARARPRRGGRAARARARAVAARARRRHARRAATATACCAAPAAR